MNNKLRDKAEAIVTELDEMDLVEFHQHLVDLGNTRRGVTLVDVDTLADVEKLTHDLADTEDEVFKLLNTIEDLLIEVERLEEIINQLHAEKED